MQTVINFIDNNGSAVFQCILYDRAENEDPFRALGFRIKRQSVFAGRIVICHDVIRP